MQSIVWARVSGPDGQEVHAPGMARLALGGAQFGLAYGIANENDAIGNDTARNIIEMADRVGIRAIDTAMSYGSSEEVLGAAGAGSWRIQTKLPPLPPDTLNVSAWVESSVQSSVERLKTDQIDTLFLHQPSDLLGTRGRELRDALEHCRNHGVVARLGISIYETAELDEILPLMAVDVVQAPLNLVDRRLITTGALQRLSDLGIAVHVRSVFLQGLLLMDHSERNRRFPEWINLWDQFDAHLRTVDASSLEVCIQFALSVPGIEYVIVGISNRNELSDVINAASGTAAIDFPDFHIDNVMLLDPRKWVSR